jgi:hypothetical protein
MLILKRLTPYWTSLSVILLLTWVTQDPTKWLWVLILVLVLPVIAVLIMHQPTWKFEYVGLTVPMLLLVGGGYTYLLIQEQVILQIAAVLCTGLFFFLFEKNLAIFLFQPAKYIPFSLEHIVTYCNVVASFFAYVSLFIFSILRLTHLRYIFIVGMVITALLVWQTFWIQKIPWNKSKWFVLVLTLVIAQLIVVVYYWPVSFFVSGILLTLVLYVLLHLSRHHLTNTLTKQLLWRYVITGSIALIILLATAQWSYQ